MLPLVYLLAWVIDCIIPHWRWRVCNVCMYHSTRTFTNCPPYQCMRSAFNLNPNLGLTLPVPFLLTPTLRVCVQVPQRGFQVGEGSFYEHCPR
jgi:hypothetical protein